jgi:hypothetical protein
MDLDGLTLTIKRKHPHTMSTAWIKLNEFTDEDLDGKTVEYETKDKGTAKGFLRARQNPEGLLAIQIHSEKVGNSPVFADPLEELLSFATLQRHPKPQRADFLLAKHIDELLRLMD